MLYWAHATNTVAQPIKEEERMAAAWILIIAIVAIVIWIIDR